jgi:hypothetical protein
VAIVSDVFFFFILSLMGLFFSILVFHTIFVMVNIPEAQLLLLLLCWWLELVCVVTFPSVVVITMFPHAHLEKQWDLGRELQLFSSWQHHTTGGAVPNLAAFRQYNNSTAGSDKTHLHSSHLYKMQYETNKYLFSSYLTMGIFS